MKDLKTKQPEGGGKPPGPFAIVLRKVKALFPKRQRRWKKRRQSIYHL